MRVSKDPEIRKQEIIDVAMQVFAEKGYETTTNARAYIPGAAWPWKKTKSPPFLSVAALKKWLKQTSYMLAAD